MRSFIILFLVFLVWSTPALAKNYKGVIPIARDQLNFVELNPSVEVFPGETVALSAIGTINVNQRNYEKRRCKYLGLKCWYEKRTRTNFRPVNEFQIEVILIDASGLEIDRKLISNGQPITLQYPLGGGFDRGGNIHAYIKAWSGGNIDRRNCRGRPSYCSSGDLTLSILSSNKNSRFQAIKDQFDSVNPNSVPADRIRSRNYLDGILLNTDKRSDEMQTLLADKTLEWSNSADDNSQSAIVQVIQLALTLSDDDESITKLNRALMTAYSKQGAYSQLERTAAEEVNRLKNSCDQSCDPDDALKLANAMKLLATAKAEKRARLKTGDITLAVATLNRGIDIMEQSISQKTLSENEAQFILELSNMYQDSADMLGLIRTPAEIKRAVEYMSKSVCLHKLSTDLTGRVFNKETCK